MFDSCLFCLIHFWSIGIELPAVRVDSKIFLLTSEGILCLFWHKYRKAIQHEARPDQSRASIFGREILGLHFQTLSLIFSLIGQPLPAFTDTDTGPYKAPSQDTCLIQSSTHPIIHSPCLCLVCFHLLSKKLKIGSLELNELQNVWICSQFWWSLAQCWTYPWPSFASERFAACSSLFCLLLPFAQINYLLFAHPTTHQPNQSPEKGSVLDLYWLNPIQNQKRPN